MEPAQLSMLSLIQHASFASVDSESAEAIEADHRVWLMARNRAHATSLEFLETFGKVGHERLHRATRTSAKFRAVVAVVASSPREEALPVVDHGRYDLCFSANIAVTKCADRLYPVEHETTERRPSEVSHLELRKECARPIREHLRKSAERERRDRSIVNAEIGGT